METLYETLFVGVLLASLLGPPLLWFVLRRGNHRIRSDGREPAS